MAEKMKRLDLTPPPGREEVDRAADYLVRELMQKIRLSIRLPNSFNKE
jgi:hypothetical protein